MKALVLSSGGADSTVCVALAVEKLGRENVATVSFEYGQKHDRELICAQKIADFYSLKHFVLSLENILKFSDCSLLKNSTQAIEHKSYADQIAEKGEGKVSTYVPFRNGLMLSSAAALAQSIYPEEDCEIWIGAHADDAAGQAYDEPSNFHWNLWISQACCSFSEVQQSACYQRRIKAEGSFRTYLVLLRRT